MSQHISSRALALLSCALVSLGACGESSTAPGGETEVVSRVTLTLTPAAGGTALSAYVDDSDGNGPVAPSAQVGTLTLPRGVTYTGTVKFENRLVTPVEDITEEVVAEADEHRVFYTASSNGVTITTTDVDSQNRPLGVRFTKAVAANATTGAGTVRVVLCHYDEAPKVASAASCTGETDINLTFTVVIAN